MCKEKNGRNLQNQKTRNHHYFQIHEDAKFHQHLEYWAAPCFKNGVTAANVFSQHRQFTEYAFHFTGKNDSEEILTQGFGS